MAQISLVAELQSTPKTFSTSILVLERALTVNGTLSVDRTQTSRATPWSILRFC